jgi:hypothetical protein
MAQEIRNNEELRAAVAMAEENRDDYLQLYEQYNDLDFDRLTAAELNEIVARMDRILNVTIQLSRQINRVIQNGANALDTQLIDSILLYLYESFALLIALIYNKIIRQFGEKKELLERELDDIEDQLQLEREENEPRNLARLRQELNNVSSNLLKVDIKYVKFYKKYFDIFKQKLKNESILARKVLRMGGELNPPDFESIIDRINIRIIPMNVEYAEYVLEMMEENEADIRDDEQRIAALEEYVNRRILEEERRRLEEERRRLQNFVQRRGMPPGGLDEVRRILEEERQQAIERRRQEEERRRQEEERRRQEAERRRQEEENRRRVEELRPLLATIPTDTWKGWTRSDIENLNSVFDTDEVEPDGRTHREMYAACPICLAYVDRGPGCIYIQGHNCKAEAETRGDQLYHRELYQKYKTRAGNIVFCSICSRICQNEPETHLKLVEHGAARATVTGRVSDPFARGEAGCKGAGGGGFNEKVMRFNAIRKMAFNLTEQIGRMTKYEAFKEIVEWAWDAPLMGVELQRPGQFNVPNTAFPAMQASEPIRKTVVPRDGYQMPTILMEGTNTVAYTDDPPLIQFHHLDAHGRMHHHESKLIGPSGLLAWIQGNHGFKCFSETCSGYLYPQEVTMALNAKKPDGSPYFTLAPTDKKVIQNYTKNFYERFALSDKTAVINNVPSLKGFFNENDSDSMFHMATDATCRVARGGNKRSGNKRRRKTKRANKGRKRLQRKTLRK